MKIVNLFGLLSCFLLAACFGKQNQCAAAEPAATEQAADASAEPAAEPAAEEVAA